MTIRKNFLNNNSSSPHIRINYELKNILELINDNLSYLLSKSFKTKSLKIFLPLYEKNKSYFNGFITIIYPYNVFYISSSTRYWEKCLSFQDIRFKNNHIIINSNVKFYTDVNITKLLNNPKVNKKIFEKVLKHCNELSNIYYDYFKMYNVYKNKKIIGQYEVECNGIEYINRYDYAINNTLYGYYRLKFKYNSSDYKYLNKTLNEIYNNENNTMLKLQTLNKKITQDVKKITIMKKLLN